MATNRIPTIVSTPVIDSEYTIYVNPRIFVSRMSSSSNLSMLSELCGVLRNNPTPQKYLVVGSMLSNAEAEVVIRSSSKVHLDDVEKENYVIAVAQTLSSNDIDDVIEKSAEEAQANALRVYGAFMQAFTMVLIIDTTHGTQFLARVIPMIRTYTQILLDSIPHARRVADYGDIFDDEVIFLCANDQLSLEARKVKIAEFIAETQEFETFSKEIRNRLENLNSSYVTFIDEVRSTTGAAAQNAAPVRGTEAETEHADPLARIAPDVGFDHPLISLAFSLSRNLAAFLTIGGLVGVGSDHGLNASLAISSAVAQWGRRKEEESAYASAGSGLNNDVNSYLSAFSKNLDGVGQYWLDSLNDAREIEDWLHDGASMAKWPNYMKLNLERGVKLYQAMSKYLRGYALGIENMHPEKWVV
ncbi:hypothetical protein P170DRAFT_475052 [Aspergillus steynii IBT 23096]|uniref:Uncharacterized protein n=1 Tax=Aspergillus steynii IBT 23096 TaxID=1392250 RepID=A0A2I2G751_9EURO|nr:uncharacterized protein P170DRAFT_475052 [Aspergillus steynii IBT 23096]PLB48704.1 hypothetical protein P170DRAFT_475052 [Aspergillus steynii IBT 23096]